MATQTFLRGDRVKYVGEHTPSLRGQLGTVANQDSALSVAVNWDEDVSPNSVYPSNLVLISTLDADEPQVGAGSVSDPLHEALQRLIKAKRAHKAAGRAKSAAYEEEALAQDLFNKALAEAAKE